MGNFFFAFFRFEVKASSSDMMMVIEANNYSNQSRNLEKSCEASDSILLLPVILTSIYNSTYKNKILHTEEKVSHRL